IEADEKVIIHVSNFRKVKRVEDVVKSFHKISHKLRAKLLLVGDGPEKNRICQLIKKLNLDDKILFLGRQDQLEELFSISDLMLLLSEKESFGLVALEAMACGVPCIGTNIDGIPEVISDGQTGFICELGNIDKIADKAISLLSDKVLHERFSSQSISAAKEKFRADLIVGQYETIYFELLKNGECI